ncbi:hypothetical protein BCR34DRAFT_334171 [Clohesyomyces aquaticus]|uniref:Uncharacterized protein n=1 Tax=Clohesyomyces aquaticus TaxID=1231657 RepID=A0A1Y1ZLY5_9PLEO|nr:hypothetical protein BCR34DRAFT_334171 [Clohesyomyces aquaticus]
MTFLLVVPQRRVLGASPNRLCASRRVPLRLPQHQLQQQRPVASGRCGVAEAGAVGCGGESRRSGVEGTTKTMTATATTTTMPESAVSTRRRGRIDGYARQGRSCYIGLWVDRCRNAELQREGHTLPRGVSTTSVVCVIECLERLPKGTSSNGVGADFVCGLAAETRSRASSRVCNARDRRRMPVRRRV